MYTRYLREESELIDDDDINGLLKNGCQQNLVLLSQDNMIKASICFRIFRDQNRNNTEIETNKIGFCELYFIITVNRTESEK